MDQIEEIPIQISGEPVPKPQLPSSSAISTADPPGLDPDHTAGSGDQHSGQVHELLKILDLEEGANENEKLQSDSIGKNEGEEENGKGKEESDGDERIESEKAGGGGGSGASSDEVDWMNARRTFSFPVRPEAEDCAYYMRTGNCKFGSNCKFNHPVPRKNQVAKGKKESEEPTQKPNQMECKYYLRTGGCKYGNDCRYIHSKAKVYEAQVPELNFLGLPIRPGEKECPFYMRNGSCKFGANCKFNHPDPKAFEAADQTPVYVNGVAGGSISPSQANVASWSVPRPLNETAPYVPVVFSPAQGLSCRSPEWNGYQTPLYPQESSMRPPAAFLMNNTTVGTSIYTHQEPPLSGDEFPERPGEPECSYFMKTGDCKFKTNCKYHHPKNRPPKPPPCTLSDKGLPLRPGQNICLHYSRYGICKFGPACKFDHPVQLPSSSPSAPENDS